jgi:hypothetical protein
VRLTGLAVFAAGYVAGSRAGRERYLQIADGMARASRRLEEFSTRRPPRPQGPGSGGADGGPRSPEAAR